MFTPPNEALKPLLGKHFSFYGFNNPYLSSYKCSVGDGDNPGNDRNSLRTSSIHSWGLPNRIAANYAAAGVTSLYDWQVIDVFPCTPDLHSPL